MIHTVVLISIQTQKTICQLISKELLPNWHIVGETIHKANKPLKQPHVRSFSAQPQDTEAGVWDSWYHNQV